MQVEFCSIEGGTFAMGTDVGAIGRQIAMFEGAYGDLPRDTIESWFRKHTPSVSVTLPSFQLSRTLITRGQFAEFEMSTFKAIGPLAQGDPQLPVEGVSYFQARQFCCWLSDRLAAAVSLPTEAEWEFAASSRGRYMFPWGDDFDPAKANTAESGIGQATRPEVFQSGISEQGVLDLAGNLEEWTDNIYMPYAGGYFVHDDISAANGSSYPVLRGGCYRHHGDLCLAFRRHGYRENYTPVGFRVVTRTS